jgi:hypothetical protein
MLIWFLDDIDDGGHTMHDADGDVVTVFTNPPFSYYEYMVISDDNAR